MIGGADTHDRGRTLAEIRAEVVARLRARRPEIDQVILTRVRDGVSDPAAMSGDAEYVEGLRVAVVAAVDYALSGIEAGEGSSSAVVPAATVLQAQRAARAGVGLDTVLRRYVAGHALLEDFVMQEVDHNDLLVGRTALRKVLGISALVLDRLIASITSAYMQEVERTGRSPAGRGGSSAPERRKQRADRLSSAAGEGEGRFAMSSGPEPKTQRVRILEAMAELVAERGFAGVLVKLLTTRAGISSRTFYECFDGLEDCFLAVLDWAMERAGGVIAEAFAEEERWQDGVRTALAALLVFFDSEPLLPRIAFVEAMAAGSWALERRERNVMLVRSMIVEYWAARGDEPPEPVAAAGVMASVLGLIQTHLVTEQPEPLIELLGPLMGLVTSLYLDTRDRAREIERGAQLAREIQAGDHRFSPPVRQVEPKSMPAPSFPEALGNPSARRARECLLFLLMHPGSSNREVAVGIDVTHQSQISKLLSQLAREDLVLKHSEGTGKRNAWLLTPLGEEIARGSARTARLTSGDRACGGDVSP